MFEYLRQLAIRLMRTRALSPPLDPPLDPDAAVREPRPLRPAGRSAAAAMQEPEPPVDVTAIGSTALAVCLAVGAALLTSCAPDAKTGNDKTAAASAPAPVTTEKPFATGGRVEMQLPGGEYEIRPAIEDRIRVTLTGNQGNTKVDIATLEKGASVKLSDTPRNDFRATIEVPRATDLVVRLSGGNLTVGPVAGNKDIEAYAGNVTIAIPDPAEYGSAEASVKAGDLDARPFGESKSGLMSSFKWSGSGKHTLRATLGAGNLKLEGR